MTVPFPSTLAFSLTGCGCLKAPKNLWLLGRHPRGLDMAYIHSQLAGMTTPRQLSISFVVVRVVFTCGVQCVELTSTRLTCGDSAESAAALANRDTSRNEPAVLERASRRARMTRNPSNFFNDTAE